ncbi:hypothetical protein [Okeania sp. SIO2B3]|uniref:hypothetical protein n=1 Tax=Okeania sp. SIO2B3 TaxID=2607784 RepID=UPI0013C16C70|nr:hypothetical protein [Okeania sp. SIO2B3]NET41305.1 hypothetical protein [Okeania sp. SIO2B3]
MPDYLKLSWETMKINWEIADVIRHLRSYNVYQPNEVDLYLFIFYWYLDIFW